jgi:hypothetical protein
LQVRAFFEALSDGKYFLQAKEINNRSSNQNNYYWVLCEMLVAPLRDLGWDLDKDGVHCFLKDLFLKERITSSKGESFYQIKSTSKLTVTEMREYLERVIRFCAELGIEVPELVE